LVLEKAWDKTNDSGSGELSEAASGGKSLDESMSSGKVGGKLDGVAVGLWKRLKIQSGFCFLIFLSLFSFGLTFQSQIQVSSLYLHLAARSCFIEGVGWASE